MNIGETIKKLRKQKDMTQEQLAEYLNITTQAISKWETNLSLPDITLVPILANIFDVTSDVLLGIDIETKKNRIQDIINSAKQASQYGSVDNEKAIEILRAGLKEYPNSFEIMLELMGCIASISYLGKVKEDDEAKILLNEVINLGEKVLAECKNDRYRYWAIRELCSAYSDPVIGKSDKAMELAEKMPYLSEGREFLLANIYKNEKQLEQMQNNIGQCFIQIISTMNNYIYQAFQNDEKCNEKDSVYSDYTVEDGIALCQKFIALIKLMFEKDDYGSYGQFMAGMSTNMAQFYIKLNDFENAIKALQFSAEYAIKFDTEHNPDKPKSSLLFKDKIVGYIIVNMKENAVMTQLNLMKQPQFDPIRDNKEFIEIEENLKKYGDNKL